MKTVFTISILISIMLIANIAWSDIIHVPGDQPTIQAGIDAAQNGDTVLVADGTYKGDGNKEIDFKGKIIEVRSENGPEFTIIDCEGQGSNAFHFQHYEGRVSVLDGFTITNCRLEGILCSVAGPTITNNIIRENLGGGIRCDGVGADIKNNVIMNNSSEGGGGIRCGGKSITVSNNIIIGNSATDNGGGIYGDNLQSIINNIIIGNSAGQSGGGIYFHNCSPILINNTLIDNSAGEIGGGIYCDYHSAPTVFNTILWGNNPQEIELSESTVYVTYSDVKGGWPGEGNIDADPLFVDPDSDFHLSDYSPCIGAGIMTPDVPDTDIEGNLRPNPPGSNPDMGAYENPLAAALGSISGNVVDADTGNPITFALVIAINADTKDRYKTFTDEAGDYDLPELPPNTYWVICIKKGYQAGITKIEVEPGAVTPCHFVLRRKVE